MQMSLNKNWFCKEAQEVIDQFKTMGKKHDLLNRESPINLFEVFDYCVNKERKDTEVQEDQGKLLRFIASIKHLGKLKEKSVIKNVNFILSLLLLNSLKPRELQKPKTLFQKPLNQLLSCANDPLIEKKAELVAKINLLTQKIGHFKAAYRDYRDRRGALLKEAQPPSKPLPSSASAEAAPLSTAPEPEQISTATVYLDLQREKRLPDLGSSAWVDFIVNHKETDTDLKQTPKRLPHTLSCDAAPFIPAQNLPEHRPLTSRAFLKINGFPECWANEEEYVKT